MNRELMLLGVLRERGMHGYELVEFIDQNLGAWADLKRPTTYFVLEKMAESGWITSEERQEGRRPVRRVYQLTPAGEEAFQHMLRQNLASYDLHVFPEDVGLAFLDTLPPAEVAGLLRERRAAILALRDELAHVPAHPGPVQWVFEHHLRHLEAELAWVDEVITRIETQFENQK